jgi:hypothetical protein
MHVCHGLAPGMLSLDSLPIASGALASVNPALPYHTAARNVALLPRDPILYIRRLTELTLAQMRWFEY